MFRKKIAPTWTSRPRTNRQRPNPQQSRRRRRNERTFTNRADAGRRIFREQPIRWAFFPARTCCSGRARAMRRRRTSESASVQLFLVVCVCVFLHALRRVLFLDNRPSCDRRRVERGRAPAIGKYCCVADGTCASVCADSSAPSPPVCVDGHSAWSRTVARHQAGVSQLDFLFRARRSLPGVLPFGGARI